MCYTRMGYAESRRVPFHRRSPRTPQRPVHQTHFHRTITPISSPSVVSHGREIVAWIPIRRAARFLFSRRLLHPSIIAATSRNPAIPRRRFHRHSRCLLFHWLPNCSFATIRPNDRVKYSLWINQRGCCTCRWISSSECRRNPFHERYISN